MGAQRYMPHLSTDPAAGIVKPEWYEQRSNVLPGLKWGPGPGDGRPGMVGAGVSQVSGLVPQRRASTVRSVAYRPGSQAELRENLAEQVTVLLLCNLVWSGLGNLSMGDRRGWRYGFLHWLALVASIHSFGVPSVALFLYASVRGYGSVARRRVERDGVPLTGRSETANVVRV